jgi:class 3 adenylate cyclase
MLFGDVKNFSKLTEEQAPFFFHHFLTRVAELAQGAAQQPVFSNTWGDGLFLVFDDVAACAAFALDLLDCVRDTDWQRWNLPADTTVRIGLHAGPVFPELDPVIRRRNFFGSHVNRAARIEPVTTPGCAFATEQFAGLLAASGTVEVHCEYVGVEDLAKGYDRCALYRLARGGAAA